MVEEFEIKLATIENMKAIFDLSNDASVRENSFNQEKIEWSEHQIWFKKKLEDKNCIFYVIKNSLNIFVGYVRLDNKNGNWTITIHLTPESRGKGYGSKILKNIVELNQNKKIIACVKEKNVASYKSFLHAGFRDAELVTDEKESFYKLEI